MGDKKFKNEFERIMNEIINSFSESEDSLYNNNDYFDKIMQSLLSDIFYKEFVCTVVLELPNQIKKNDIAFEINENNFIIKLKYNNLWYKKNFNIKKPISNKIKSKIKNSILIVTLNIIEVINNKEIN